ncbi:MAG: hypothetical protein FWH36_06005 [Lentimicrobiaceae bacterium]|nr:hypothetical protein [Lentimicrobiaceae bacterium]
MGDRIRKRKMSGKPLQVTGGLPSVLLRGGVMAAVAPRKARYSPLSNG